MPNLATVLLALLAAVSVQGRTVVANYRSDFEDSGNLANGWKYLWNAPTDWTIGNSGEDLGGFLGAPSSYKPLVLAEGRYTPEGATPGSNPTYGFLQLTKTGGHPGPQATDRGRSARYAIVAFTVPADGLYRIENSFLEIPNSGSDGVEVLIFPGNSEALSRTQATPSEVTSFDLEVGYMEVGETIYVAFGPSSTAAFDGFQMDFQIVRYERLSLHEQLINGIASGANPITLLPGRYFANPPAAYIRIEKFAPARQTAIIADGVRLIMQSPNRALGFIDCQNFTLQGLVVDYDPNLYRQGTVESISGGTFNIRLHEGFPQALTTSATSGIIYEAGNLRMKQLTDTYYPTTVQLVEPGLYAVTTPSPTPNLAIGDFTTLTEPVNIPHALYLEDCSDVLIKDLELNGSPAFALLSRDGQRIHLDNVRVVPGPQPIRASIPRLLSSNADGLHFKDSAGDISVTNCRLAYTGDDSIVLTSAFTPIISKPQDHVIAIAAKSRLERLSPGDLLFIYDRVLGTREDAVIQSIVLSPLSKAEVQAEVAASFPLARITSSTFEQAWIVTLNAPISASVGGLVANRGKRSSDFSIANNCIENTRARGILIKASNGVVCNNVIFNSLLPGIQVRPEGGIWLEGDFAQNVLIEGNELRRTALGRSNSFAPIYVSAEGFETWQPGTGHANLSIVRNQIFNAPGASIIVEYADMVTLRSNRFITSHNILGAIPWFDSVIYLERTNQVNVVGLNLALAINQTNANLSAMIASGPQVTELGVSGEILHDRDQDGLPDDWELQFFGDTTIAKPEEDPDGDHQANDQEFIMGSHPHVVNGVFFRISPDLRIEWAPRSDRFVSIYTSDEPAGTYSIFTQDVPAENGSFDLPAPAGKASLFYRLKIGD